MSADEKDRVQTLEEQLSQARALLSHTVDTLQEERRLNAVAKNRVTGGYYMMSRAAEKNLRAIQRESPSAALVFSVIRENMQIGTNAVTVSQAALCKILNKSRATISRATKYLADNRYVQIIKTGNVSTYVVNEQIAFAGSVGQRKAVFSATIVAHECEQEEGWDEVRKLKSVPVIYGDERPILGSEIFPPPDQTDLDLT
ncbi:helix-turn-helix domain-containing protein [Enterobacter hormaechei]|uniref:plasmid replication initiator-like protein n=1 Tax=Enterobacteriaceae TaxID=543 RepID=UPI00115B933A|nr:MULTISPECIES: plasmid replication initiator-like protein [Enterobacteriaceae]HCX3926404.1 plasmid replication initiator-like protein [Escherichia coli]MCG0494832.1 helix-turn-helix domain-containing protein [Enterobacter hormaechei]MCG0535532.1 helix-turn-helix domain-containing protein [Enterobacter hormaechei]MCG0549648.1 helix-turn-helix domain-containing protein [Enterobacter hormaechei]MCG0554285.1 helix-turn-helix domain-containing protein [Enterobacter hormaechei]